MEQKAIQILLVEDDPGYARLITEMSKGVKGAELVMRHAGLLMEGINILAEQKIDVVLLDLTLPDSEGLDTFLRIKGMVPETPIVVLTGREDEKLALTAVREGAQDYIFKTEMRPPILIRSLRYAVERKRAQEALKRAHDLLEVKVKERTAELETANKRLKAEIEEKKRAEEALKENENLFRATIESTGDGIFVVNENGEVTHKNARFAELWRVPEDVLNTNNDGTLLAFFLGKLEDPEAFLSSAHGLYHTTKESRDTLRLKDGRFFERRTCPLIRSGSYAGRVWSFTDITDRARSEKGLRESEERFRGIAERSFDIIYETDREGVFTYVSPAFERLLGRAPNEIVGTALTDLAPAPEQPRAIRWMTGILGGTSAEAFQIELVKKDGATATFEINASPIYKNKETVGSQGICRDITERKVMQERVLVQSQTDGLTGLFNQRHFFKMIENEMKRAKRIPYPLSLMMLDVENFGTFNQTNGRRRGDELLKELGAVIRRCIRKDLDIACRYGGDEFAIILPNSEKDQALSVARRIQERATRKLGGIEVKVGITSLDGALSPDAFISEAERAMKLQTVFSKKKAAQEAAAPRKTQEG